jgi:hypothetical protein
MSGRTILALGLGVGAVAILAPALAAAKGPSGRIDVATNGRGDVAAAWTRTDGRVVVSQVALLGDPRPPVRVASSFGDDEPAIALDGAGRVWWAWSDGGDGTSRIRVASRPRAGAESRPRTIASERRAGLWHPSIAVGGGGAGVVAWDAQSGRQGRLEAATLPGGRRAVLWRGRGVAEGHVAAVDAAGAPIVAWSADGALRVAEAAGGRWRTRVLGRAAARDGAPALAVGPGGRAAVAWTDPAGHLAVAERTDGGWGAPRAVAAGGREARLTYAPDGSLAAALTAGDLLEAHVLVVRRAEGGAFGAPRTVSPPGRAACRPDLAARADGTFALAWTAALDAYVCDETGLGLAGRAGIAAATLRDGVPGPVRTVAPADARNDQPRVAVGRGGAVRVLWSRLPAGAHGFELLRTRVADVGGGGGPARARDLDRAGDVFPPALWPADLSVSDGRWAARVHAEGAASLEARLERADGGRVRLAGRPRTERREGEMLTLGLGALAPGTYRLSVRARDARGNAATLARTFTTRPARLAVSGDGAGRTATFLMPEPASVVARLRDPSGHRVLRVLAAGRLRAGTHRLAVCAVPAGGARLEVRATAPGELATIAWATLTGPR